jgi:hypothetical protein
VARDNYSYKKYQKELDRKKKAEEKKQKKLDKKALDAAPHLGLSDDQSAPSQGESGQAPGEQTVLE